MGTIENRVKRVVKHMLGDDPKLDSRLADDLGADSLDMIEIVMAVEEEFEIDVPDDICDNWETVREIVNYIESRI